VTCAIRTRLQVGDTLVTCVLTHFLSPAVIDRFWLLVAASATVLAFAFLALIVCAI
jgi:hypothetical protein